MTVAMHGISYGAAAQRWSGQARLSSREVCGGELFAALPGHNHDGHKFIGDAVSRGASLILCRTGTAERLRSGDLPWPSDMPLSLASRVLSADELRHGGWLIEVDNVEQALQQLATERRQTYRGTVIGITGSFGKTTAKEILRQLLPQSQATMGNLNNHLGVPVSVLNFDPAAPCWICEMGMNHPGELARLGEIAQADLLLFTPLGRAHIGEADGDWIPQAKTELLRVSRPPRAIWMPRSSAGYARHLAGFTGALTWYGLEAGATDDWHVEGAHESFPDRAQLQVRYRGQRATVSWDVPYADYAGSVLAGLMIRAYLGQPLHDMQLSLRAHMGNRMRISEPASRQWFVNDAYNASPETMAAAAQWCGRRQSEGYGVLALLGDMFELGAQTGTLHREALQAWQKAGVDWRLALRAGDFGQAAQDLGLSPAPALAELPSWQELVRFVRRGEQGQIVFAKGSNGSGLGRQLDAVLAADTGALKA